MTFTGGKGVSSYADEQRVTAQRTTLVVALLALVLAGIRSFAPVDPTVWLVLAIASVVIPGFLSQRSLDLCWAVTRTTSARCRRRRKGFLTRCRDHRGTNTFDYLGAGLAIVAASMAVWALFTFPDFSA